MSSTRCPWARCIGTFEVPCSRLDTGRFCAHAPSLILRQLDDQANLGESSDSRDELIPSEPGRNWHVELGATREAHGELCPARHRLRPADVARHVDKSPCTLTHSFSFSCRAISRRLI